MRSLKSKLNNVKNRSKAFEGAGRNDLASKEQAEAEIISQFLPEAMTEEELDSIIEQTIAAQKQLA